jgi:3-phosphoshikimate 1-carboxyvinyltransferase
MGTVTIEGTGGTLVEPDRVLDCGNSGTTLRLLAGVLASQPLFAVLTGDDSLRRRPVARIIEPLRRMGAILTARDQDRYPPLAISGGSLRGVDYSLPVPSAQVASCTLLAGLKATGRTTVRIPGAARDHTERMLRAFGVPVEQLRESAGAVSVSITGPAELLGCTLAVPGDFSSAAFFLAAAAACPGGNVTAEGVGLNPTRTGLLDVLEAMGAQVTRTNVREQGGEPVGDVTVIGPRRSRRRTCPRRLLPAMIDEVPAWVIAASAARGTSRLTGAAELRVKESDRLAMLARNLGAIGIAVEESAAGLAITGAGPGAARSRPRGSPHRDGVRGARDPVRGSGHD